MECMSQSDQPNEMMPRARSRSGARNRHGRALRSPVTGPLLPILYSRIENFHTIVGQTLQYLRSMWPNELANLHMDFASAPPRISESQEVERWRIHPGENRITLYRVPIQRLGRLHKNDDLHRQMAIEGAVIHAIAEYLGKEPWELGPHAHGHN
jgi:hypothetical protein